MRPSPCFHMFNIEPLGVNPTGSPVPPTPITRSLPPLRQANGMEFLCHGFGSHRSPAAFRLDDPPRALIYSSQRTCHMDKPTVQHRSSLCHWQHHRIEQSCLIQVPNGNASFKPYSDVGFPLWALRMALGLSTAPSVLGIVANRATRLGSGR